MENVEIETAYKALESASETLYEMTTRKIAAEIELKEAEAYLILSGECEGKNAETRMASLRQKTVLERDVLQKAEADWRDAKQLFDLASLKVECIRLTIRNLEINRPAEIPVIDQIQTAIRELI